MNCKLILGNYDKNNRLAVEAEYWVEPTGDEPEGEWDIWGVITKNVIDWVIPAETEQHVYAYLNANEFPHIVQTLEQAGLGELTEQDILYPLFKFDKQALADFVAAGGTIEL